MSESQPESSPAAVLLFEVRDGIAHLTLNRPGRLNAFDADLAEAWALATTEAVGREDVRAILISGSGRAFCAGGDVQAMSEMPGGGAALSVLAERINVGIRALLDSSIPVVTAAHGTTAGGGLGILLAGDYAVVGEGSRIGSLYANIGLTPDLSVSALLGRAVGERRALQLTLQDRLLTAQEAREWGLVAEVVPDGDVQARAERVARFWADGAAAAYGSAKRLVRAQPTRGIDEQLADEAQSIGAALDTPDAQARVRAFVERSARR